MPLIELWEKTGKGAMKYVHDLWTPVEAVALEDVKGNLYPIYEGHNYVPTGMYCLVILRPYPKKDQKPVERQSHLQVEVRREDANTCCLFPEFDRTVFLNGMVCPAVASSGAIFRAAHNGLRLWA